MEIDGDSALLGEALRLSPFGRNPIDVPQQIKENPATVGRDVHGHPGPLLGSKVDLSCLPSRASHIPCCVIILRGRFGAQSTPQQRGKQQHLGHRDSPSWKTELLAAVIRGGQGQWFDISMQASLVPPVHKYNDTCCRRKEGAGGLSNCFSVI